MWKTKCGELWKTQTLVCIKGFYMWKTMWKTCGKLILVKSYPHTYPQFYSLFCGKIKKCKVNNFFYDFYLKKREIFIKKINLKKFFHSYKY